MDIDNLCKFHVKYDEVLRHVQTDKTLFNQKMIEAALK